MSTVVYGGSPPRGRNSGARHKRKSAVELLAESKAFYVKSETVLDRQQQLPSSLKPTNAHFILVSPSRSLPAAPRPASRRSASAGSDLLQTKLRKLLNCSDSKENVCTTDSALKFDKPPVSMIQTCVPDRHDINTNNRNDKIYNTYNKRQFRSDNCYNDSPDTSNVYNTQFTMSQNDVATFFPTTFLSPQSLPPRQMSDSSFCDQDSSLYPGFNIESLELTGKSCDNLNLTDDYRAISPPAEYAVTERSNYRCVRSYSHSQPIQQAPSDHCFNINSHKSLPDLYSQTTTYLPQPSAAYNDEMCQQNMGHSNEALSCCSKGTKSNRSDVFSKSNKSSEVFIKSSRSNSSFNRDSGGSSGHYTHRSEPIKKNSDYRRDSGSSTQHSGNSAYYDNITYNRTVQRFPNIIETQIAENCAECQAIYQDRHTVYKDRQQYKQNNSYRKDDPNLIHFQTPAVPEAFQDNYDIDQKPIVYGNNGSYYEGSNRTAKENSNYNYTVQDYSGYNKSSKFSPEISDQNRCHGSPMYSNSEYRENHSGDYQKSMEYHEYQEGAASLPVDPELSPPLGTFKRQKCLRFKHRQGRYSAPSTGRESDDRRPILRSKSDISDRYWRGDKVLKKSSKPSTKSVDYDTFSQLERFFEQLGLNDETYDAVMMENVEKIDESNSSENLQCESPVFFSDVSTVDSNRPAESTEYSNTVSVGNAGIFRSCEPPSIVERNARIIKWLCNCRKMQMAAK